MFLCLPQNDGRASGATTLRDVRGGHKIIFEYMGAGRIEEDTG